VKWIILLLGIVSNASASVLIKVAMTPPRTPPSLSAPMSILTNWPLLLGLVLYGGTFLMYAAALARLPLNVAHPVMTTGAVAAVAVFSFAILKEPFPTTTLAGVALVVLGVALITMGVG
jgi:multidrug transporter EmrE-like cation transporter